MLDVFWIWHWEIQHMPFEFLMLKMFTCGVFWEIYLQIQVIDNFSSSSRPRTASYTSFDSSWPSSLWTTVKILQYRNMWYTHFLSFYISHSSAWASAMLHACTLEMHSDHAWSTVYLGRKANKNCKSKTQQLTSQR